MVAAGLLNSYGFALESFSYAERHCEHLVPPGVADSTERYDCINGFLAKHPFEVSIWYWVTAAAIAGAGMILVEVGLRRSLLAAHELREDGTTRG